MKSTSFLVAIAAMLLVMSGCNNGDFDRESVTEKNTATPPAIEKVKEPTERQFIRSSEMKFRVNDVTVASQDIEDITRRFNGFITYAHLESNKSQENTIKKSLDSSLERIEYTMTNDIILRVPNEKLDSTLHAITALVDFIDYKTIKADDVALQIKANELSQKRAQTASSSIADASKTKAARVSESTSASMAISEKQESADAAIINNLSLKDQIAYSTIKLSIYQRTETRFWTVASDHTQNIQANMGVRILDAVKTGWYFAQDVFILILRMWFVFVLALIGYFFYRKLSKNTLIKR